jgi:nicotinamidase-related amidase
VTYFRAHHLPVVYLTLGSDFSDYRDLPTRSRALVLDLEARSGLSGILWSEDPAFRIRDEIAPAPGEAVVRKTTAGAFNSSEIDARLRAADIENLVVTGVTTSCCVESTAREASDHGYGCVLIADAMAEYDQEAHEATLRTFHANFGRVLTSATDVIHAIEEGTEL